jgi:hypothetical protein
MPQPGHVAANEQRFWIIRKADFFRGVSDAYAVDSVPDWKRFKPGGIAGFNPGSYIAPTQMYGTPPTSVGTYLVSNSAANTAEDPSVEQYGGDYMEVVAVSNPLAWVNNGVGQPTFTRTPVRLGMGVIGSGNWDGKPASGLSMDFWFDEGVRTNAVWRDGYLWTTHVAVPAFVTDNVEFYPRPAHPERGQFGVHWAKIATSTMTRADQGWIGGENIELERSQSDPSQIFYATNTETAYPSIDVNAAGDAVITFTAFGEKIYPGAYYALRRAGDPAGSFRDPAPLAKGTGDSPFTTFGGRLEDFSGTAVDPSDDTRFWMYNTYAMPQAYIDPSYPQYGSRVGTMSTTPNVIGRHLFYNNSHFDQSNPPNNDPGNNEYDDAAVSDKVALRPGQTASFSNYTSYNKGINGLMVEIDGLADDFPLTTSDFEFRMGNDANPGQWGVAPTPSSIDVRRASGVPGTRVAFVWPDYNPADPNSTTNAVANKWLRVTVKANANTGLSQPDAFYFGNLIGDTHFSSTGDYITLAEDYSATKNAVLANPGGAVNVLSEFDHNRDGLLTTEDDNIVHDNFFAQLFILNAPV